VTEFCFTDPISVSMWSNFHALSCVVLCVSGCLMKLFREALDSQPDPFDEGFADGHQASCVRQAEEDRYAIDALSSELRSSEGKPYFYEL